MRKIVFFLFTVLLGVGCAVDSAAVHDRAFVVDAHSDALYRLYTRGGDLGTPTQTAHVDIQKLRAGGVDLQFLAVWVPSRYVSEGENDPDSSAIVADAIIDTFFTQLERNSADVGFAHSADEAREIHRSGKIALALGIEGGHVIENSLELLEHFYDRGVRYMTLTWMNSTDWAVAAREEPDVGPEREGLTELGRSIVSRMNDLGMIIDVSHVDKNTFHDVLDVSRKPVIASHSCAAALHHHYRNLTDEQLRDLAANGGVLCINFYPNFLDSSYRQAYNIAEAEYEAEIDSIRSLYRETDWGLYLQLRSRIISRKTSGHEVTIDTIIDHIDHVVKVAGIDHVGLGSDFDGIDVTPEGMENASMYPRLTRRLLERGYSPQEVEKIMGANIMRVFSAVAQ